MSVFVFVPVLIIGLMIGFRLGRKTAPSKVVHHNHKDDKAVFNAYLTGFNDGIEAYKESVRSGVRMDQDRKNKSLFHIIDPHIAAIVGELHVKKCKYNVEWFDTQELAAINDRPSNVPSDFIRIWDPTVQDYVWQKPA